MRWFLFCFLLRLAFAEDSESSESKWEDHYQVIPLIDPDIDNKEYFGEPNVANWPDWAQSNPIIEQLRHPTKDTYWKAAKDTLALALHFPITHGSVFDHDTLNKLRKEHPNVKGNDSAWEQFNKRYPTHDLGIYGSAWDIVRLYAMRRVCLDDILVDEGLEAKMVKNGIEFDEYSSYRDCVDLSVDPSDHTRHFGYIPPTRRIGDRIEFINGTIRYIRYNTVCITPGLNYCSTLSEAFDDNQGRPVEALAGIKLRMIHHRYSDPHSRKPTSIITVKKWRLFDFCVRDDKMGGRSSYPTIDKRLLNLGFTEELLNQVNNRYQRLALRRFAQPSLTEWRAFNFDGYEDSQILALQHQERQLWLNKFQTDQRNDKLFH